MVHYMLIFFDFGKLFLPGVALHLRLFRFPENALLFMKGTDEEAKTLDGKVQTVIEKAYLSVRKVVVMDSVKLFAEKALLKSPAIYSYIESLSRSIIFKLHKIVSCEGIFLERSPFAD